jgi:hexokinase
VCYVLYRDKTQACLTLWQDVPVNMTALINDTTGTLIASHYVDPKTKIAVIFGTGCNAAYMEDMKNIEKMKDAGISDDAQMAINCEWVCRRAAVSFHELTVFQGAFDSFAHEHLPRTKYDVNVDQSSNKPGEQAFEVKIGHKLLTHDSLLILMYRN